MEVVSSIASARSTLFDSAREVMSESKQGETYSARLAVLRPCYALLKITYFPGQQATVDGKPAPIFRVYPNFCAIPVGPGEHQIEVRYRPGPIKPILLVAGLMLVGFIAQAMRRPTMPRRNAGLPRGWRSWRHLGILPGREQRWRLRSCSCSSRARCSVASCSTVMTHWPIRPG